MGSRNAGIGGRPPSTTDLRLAAGQALQLSRVDPRRAWRAAEVVLRAARAVGDLAAAAQAERALGMAARAEHDMAGAVAHLGAAVRLAERTGATDIAAGSRVSLALALAYTGRLAAAHHELDVAAELPGADAGQIDFQRAAILQMQGRLAEAEAAYTLAEPAIRQADDRHSLAMLHNNRGVIRTRTGSLTAAEADLRRAVTLHRDLGHTVMATEEMHNLGLIQAKRGHLLAALATFEEVDREQERKALKVVDAVGLLDRADVLLAARLLTEARATAEQAVAELVRRRLSAYVPEARLVLARIALAEGRHGEAAELAEQSARHFARQRRPSYRALAEEVRIHAQWLAGNRSPQLLAASQRAGSALARNGWAVAAADARLIAAQVALFLNRRAVACAQLADVAVAGRTDPADIHSRAFHARALLRLAADDRRGAAAALRAGVDVLDRHRHTLGNSELRAHASPHATELWTLGLRLALDSGDPARVLRWAERWRAGTLAVRSVRPPDDTELADALAELRAVTHPARRSATGPVSTARTRQIRLEARIRRLARRTPTFDRYESTPISIARIQDRLDERVMVVLIDVAGELHSVVLTRRRRTLHHLGPTLALNRLVVTLRYWLRRVVAQQGSPAQLSRAAEEVTLAAKELDSALLGTIPAGLADQPLVVVPTMALHALPWQILPTCTGRPVSVAPSASWWTRATDLSRRPAAAPAQVVLVAGPDLPHGATEINELGRLYPAARRFTGTAATATAVAQALDGTSLAHIAAHGHFRSDQPLLSELRLADGPLTVYDLERLTNAPSTIVLASCDAGLSTVLPGDELMGLAACLLAQGTTSLIAPLLPIPDTDALPTMLALHRRLRRGDQPSVALAGSNDELAQTRYAYTAAAFTCIGN